MVRGKSCPADRYDSCLPAYIKMRCRDQNTVGDQRDDGGMMEGASDGAIDMP